MKYNKQKIMQNAWMIYEFSKKPFLFTLPFADCLKEAWEEAKRWG